MLMPLLPLLAIRYAAEDIDTNIAASYH